MNRMMIALAVVALMAIAPTLSQAQESSSEELFGGCTYLQCANRCFARHCGRCESGQCTGVVQCLAGWCHCADFECSVLYWDVAEEGEAGDQAGVLVPFGPAAWEALGSPTTGAQERKEANRCENT